eukprot:4955064-Amphidinium_carterae.3
MVLGSASHNLCYCWGCRYHQRSEKHNAHGRSFCSSISNLAGDSAALMLSLPFVALTIAIEAAIIARQPHNDIHGRRDVIVHCTSTDASLSQLATKAEGSTTSEHMPHHTHTRMYNHPRTPQNPPDPKQLKMGPKVFAQNKKWVKIWVFVPTYSEKAPF